MIEALYALAADPVHWAELIQVLESAEPSDSVARDLTQMAYGAEHVARAPAPSATMAPAGAAVGVLIVTPAGRILSSNPLGEAAATALGFVGAPGGAKLDDPVNQDVLRAARRRLGDGRDAPVIAKFVAPHAESAIFAYVIRADRLDASLAEALPPWRDNGEATAILLPSAAWERAFWAGLQDSFGLTPAETLLTTRLADGATLDAVADDLGLSRNTVRNQLTSVFDKLGLRRQSDLIRALTLLAGLFGAVPATRKPVAGSLAGTARAQFSSFNAPAISGMRLPDGRNLAYRIYGDPAGLPVLFCHAGLGASLMPAETDALCGDLGLRLLCPERPGIGRSDPSPNHGMHEVAEDKRRFLDQLEVGSCQVCALTSGAPFGVALARLLADRVTRLVLLSPRLPPEAIQADHAASPMVRFQSRISRNLWLVEPLMAVMRLRLTRQLMGRIMRASATSPGDAAYLSTHPELVDALTEAMGEAWALGARGLAEEMKSLRRPDGAREAVIAARLEIWHGVEDTYATPAEVAAHYGAPMESVRVMKGIGNFMMAKHWPDILRSLAGNRPPLL